MKISYIVITKLPEDQDGNEYDELMQEKKYRVGFGPDGDIIENRWCIPKEYNHKKKSIRVKLPAFSLGEIIIASESGRELVGRGRKPDKWFVEYETFKNIEDAVIRARQVLDYPPV